MSLPQTGRRERAREYVGSPEFKRLWRYASVSAITTVFSIGLLYVFFRVVKVGSAALSNVLATVIATVPSYYLNRMWAWGKSGKSHLMREVIPFWVIAFVSLILSTLAVALAQHEAHRVTSSKHVETLVILLANFVTYSLLWVAKYAFFNKVLFKHHGPVDDEAFTDEGALSAANIPLEVK